MLIGVPKEIKPQENRVGLTPESVKELIDDGNEVIIERTAGQGSGFDDQNYKDVGATVFENAQDIFDRAELIIKVKEPQEDEIKDNLKEFGVDRDAPDLFSSQEETSSTENLLSQDNEDQEDDLEIPAFLRRQKN